MSDARAARAGRAAFAPRRWSPSGRGRTVLRAALALTLLGACSTVKRTADRVRDEVDPPTSSTAAPSTTGGFTAPTVAGGGPLRVRVEKLVDTEAPVAMAVRSGDPHLYIASKTGKVSAVRGGKVERTVLDLSGEVSGGGEQGLLGLTFSPDGSHAYVDFTDTDGDTRVVEFAVATNGTWDLSSRRQLLYVDQPYVNHNGGQVVFGPDGDLYIGMGDGGSSGDPRGNAQNLGTLLGKILRIDPTPGNGRDYQIPPDNPFVAKPGARAEIWAYGLRNPWRFSFDRRNGDLWIGDVGEHTREEIDLLPRETSTPGANLGWSLMEGNTQFKGAPPDGYTAPVYDYPNGNGDCAVTGGYRYRGTTIKELAGVYLFGDSCGPRVRGLVQATGGWHEIDLGANVDQLVSFGEDAAGELYALSLAGTVYRIVAP